VGTLELWGGHECTVNRIHNRYIDQSQLSGHDQRADDLSLFSDLGLKALRYPVLWEKVSPRPECEPDFRSSDARLAEIRRLGMRPIVGLCHHGSGPRHTSLLDDEGFALGLAAHARACAERYSWVQDWTPVNEPLTTARFSALYGLWYPHGRSEGAFWRALLNEIDATRLAMRAIREAIPGARLVQTEDLGYCHATGPMAAQAAYENERRWITWDLLCGRVTPDHPLWLRIRNWGLEDRLRRIADDPCPPDILGVNHYLSSERLLDHRAALYPESLQGGDGPGPYVNIEAVRTVAEGPLGVTTLLHQTWERYGLPIAITECHNGCTREEQARWFDEVWRSAEAVRAQGVDLRAVTAWALLGSYDWNTLLTQETGHYEPGVFDLSLGAEPRPTAMVELLKALSSGRAPQLPILNGRGWWRRPDRFFEQAVTAPRRDSVPLRSERGRPLLIVGNGAGRAEALARAAARRELACLQIEAGACEHSLAERARQAIVDHRPHAMIILAEGPLGERLRGLARSEGLAALAWGGGPASEPGPGELLVRSGDSLSEGELHLFTDEVIDSLRFGRGFRAASNRAPPPSFLPDAANAVLDLMVDGATGEIALAAAETMSWADLAMLTAIEADLDPFLVEAVPIPRVGAAPRPRRPLAGQPRPLPSLASAVRRRIASWTLVDRGRSGCRGSVEAAALPHAAE
jgi:dTDP-4-dehydrorhamnose reductase